MEDAKHSTPSDREIKKTGAKRTAKKGRGSTALLAVLIFVCLLAVIFYISGGLGTYTDTKTDAQAALDTRSRLASMEEQPLYEPQKAEALEEEQQEMEPAPAPDVDIAALQAELLANFGDYDYNSEYFRGWFEDSCIVGDSMALAIAGFEWIYDWNLQAEVGISLPSSYDVIEGTIMVQPSVIFLTFSANNIATYGTAIDAYISDYSDIIMQLKDSVPGAAIYVQAIMPCDPDFSEEYWYYDLLDEYNSQMRTMCEELGVNYYDPGFILYAHPDIYSEDGLHPTWEFYPLWMTYMAKIAGLS